MNRELLLKNERHAWIFLNRIPELGPVRFRRLLLAAKSAQGILELPVSGLLAADVPRERAEIWHRTFRDPQAERWLGDELERLARGLFGLVTELDEGYPALLRELFDRPPVLYYRGRWPLAGPTRVGLVGTRHPSEYGRSVAERLAADLCVQGVVTVSGLAKGIDTSVHNATLRAGGETIAVLGCGLGHVFPKENAGLQERIVEKGTLISEFAYDMAPAALHFPRRNRIISGLSHGVVVIEAARRSGASITARFAAEQGRDVFAVPGRIFQSTSVGCHRLIKQGAKLIENAADILDELQIEKKASSFAPPAVPQEDAIPLTDLEKQIKQLLADAPLSADEISQGTSRRFEDVAQTLLSLELKGLIRTLPGQRYGKN